MHGIAANRRSVGLYSRYLTKGYLHAKRDWGYAKDFVYGMWLMLQQERADDFILATGETHTVREMVDKAAQALDIDLVWEGEGLNERGINRQTNKTIIEIDPRYFRPAEVDVLLGDYSKAKRTLGWKPKVKFSELVEKMTKHDYDQHKKGNKHYSAKPKIKDDNGDLILDSSIFDTK